MNHSIFLQALRSTVGRHDGVYQSVREREVGLAAFATAPALFDALSGESALDSTARQRLLRVVVLEYQRVRHPLWHALAFRGLEPMLGGLRKRLRARLPAREGDADEREQELQLAFVEALGRLRVVRAGGPIFPLLTLRRAIARVLFPRDASERELAEECTFDEGALACAPSPHEEAQPYVHCLAREVGALVVQCPGGEDAVRVLAGAETLCEQAERLSADPRSYERQQQRHFRTVRHVRRTVGGKS